MFLDYIIICFIGLEMNDRLCFEVYDNKGYFVFSDIWFGLLLGEFEEVFDVYDVDEISEMSYINKF